MRMKWDRSSNTAELELHLPSRQCTAPVANDWIITRQRLKSNDVSHIERKWAFNLSELAGSIAREEFNKRLKKWGRGDYVADWYHWFNVKIAIAEKTDPWYTSIIDQIRSCHWLQLFVPCWVKGIWPVLTWEMNSWVLSIWGTWGLVL